MRLVVRFGTTVALLMGALSACSPEEPDAASPSGPTVAANPVSSEQTAASSPECDIFSLGAFDALIIPESAAAGGSAVAEAINSVTPIVEIKVREVMANSGVRDLKPGDLVTVAVYGDPPTVDASESELGRAVLSTHPGQVIALYPDSFGGAQWYPRIYSADVTTDKPIVAGDWECGYSNTLTRLASATGISSASQLLIDLRDSADPSRCDSSCLSFRQTAYSATSDETVPGPTSWADLAPDKRSIDMRQVPQSVLSKLAVTGIVTNETGDSVPPGAFRFRCELGLSMGWVAAQGGHILPVAVCRDLPLVVEYQEDRDGAPWVVVGKIAADTLSLDNGVEVSIKFSAADGEMSLTARQLADGELEQLSNMSAEQLEELRKEFSTPTSAGS